MKHTNNVKGFGEFNENISNESGNMENKIIEALKEAGAKLNKDDFDKLSQSTYDYIGYLMSLYSGK